MPDEKMCYMKSLDSVNIHVLLIKVFDSRACYLRKPTMWFPNRPNTNRVVPSC